MLSRLIVYFAYFLKTSRNYQRTKLFFYNVLENPNSRIKAYFDVFMIGLVTLSVFLLIYEVDDRSGEIFPLFENGIVLLFIIEYLIRLWLYNDSHKIILEHYEKSEYLDIPFSPGKVVWMLLAKKIEYMASPLAVIDLLAILPSYRPLRFLRVFLIFRLFKLFRYVNSIKLFTDVLASKRFELYTLAIFLGFLIFIGSTAIFLFEHPSNGGHVENLFEGFYWTVVTLSTVGYGDITPQTPGGRLVAVGLIFTGLGVLSFFTSIIVSAFNDKMQDMFENRTYAELDRYDNVVIICGFGRVGESIARHLNQNKQHFVIIDPSESVLLKARQLNYHVIHADASNNRVLERAGINKNVSAVLCATGDDVTNVYITLTGRQLNPNVRIISRVNDNNNMNKLYQAGANHVIQPFEIAAMVVAEYVGQPVAFEAILGIIREEKQLIMETVPVPAGSSLDGKKIGDIDLEHSKLLLIGVISANPEHRKQRNWYQLQNQHFYFNPDKNFQLTGGDLLVVLGRLYGIEYFRDQIGKSRLNLGGTK
ncbi:MAG: NAD-binding protein [Gammaproteobacteria bacterium]